MDLDQLIHRQARITRLLKYLDEKKKEVRGDFFGYADAHIENHNLPVTSISVPRSFFESTDLSYEDFLKTRFPSWQLVGEQDDGDFVVFVLKKRSEYMPYVTANNTYEISRIIAETTPEVDWDSMQKESPDLFNKFKKEVVMYELDAEVFQQYMNDNPDFDAQGFLARHTIHKKPVQKVLAKQVKDG